MKKNILLLITGAIMIFLMSGCPYESPVPLSNSCNSILDPDLLGKWVDPASDGNKDTVEIMKFNEHEYYIEIRMTGPNGITAISKGRGFVTLVKNQKIINYCELGEPDKFVFLKYEISGNLMKTFSVSDKYIKQPMGSGSELFTYFSMNLDQPGFYESPDSALRVK